MVRSGSLLSIAPFLRLLFPLCLGVFFSSFENLISPVTRVLLITIVFLFLTWSREGSFYFQPVWSFLLMLVVLFFGIIRSWQERMVFPKLPDQTNCVVLDDYPKEKEKTCQLVGQIINSDRKILIYLPKSSMAMQACPGNCLVFDGIPEIIENEGNPFEFDYRSYLNDKGIGYRIFLKEGKFFISENQKYVNFYHRALIFRKILIDRLVRSGIKIDNVHLIGSISFGARDDVDKDTIQSFTNTGVIHVLAVSGMNVGLIYIVLDFLFRFLKSGRAGSFIHTLLMITGIWGYTIITGMSASILRAAVMFTFVIVGNSLRRNSNIINSLAVSAFILIAYNPAIIRDVGFQLSYAALLSIVVIQPYIYKLIFFRNMPADKVWLLLSVTFAAQLGTLPFTLLYFHQFPVYFWLANLIVVPLVTMILYLSVVLLFLSLFSGFLTSFTAKILDWSADLVMLTVHQVGKLPYSVISNIHPAFIQMVLFVLTAYLFILYFRRRTRILIYGALVSAILLAISEGISLYRQKTREEIVFYNIQGTRAIALTTGRQSIVLYDRCDDAEEKLGYFMSPYFGERGITNAKFYMFNDSLRINVRNVSITGDFISYNGKRIFVVPLIEGAGRRKQLPVLDLVWLRNSRISETEFNDFKNCGIILYKSSGSREKEVEHPPGSKVFQMNQSVLFEFSSPRKTGHKEFSCDYFNSKN